MASKFFESSRVALDGNFSRSGVAYGHACSLCVLSGREGI
jgi:hypothetical protein